MKLAFLLFVSCLAVGCSKPEPPVASSPTPTPTPSKLEQALEDEMLVIGTTDERLRVREAAKEYLKSSRPQLEVKGMSLTYLDKTSTYQIAVDANEKSQSKII